MKALIFDVDGTLAETEALHLDAFNVAFAAVGLPWVWSEADYLRLLTTTGGKERIARHVRETGGDPDILPVAEIHAEKTRRYVAMMAAGRIALRPGVAALLAEARAAGLKLAVATTTTPANVDALIQATLGRRAAEIFDVVAAGDMVAVKKPAPDIYLLALERLGVAPDAALAFEDSHNGLKSARAAGLRVVVTPGLFTAGEDFTGADRVLDTLPTLAELLAPVR